jgi:hypothetical protein
MFPGERMFSRKVAPEHFFSAPVSKGETDTPGKEFTMRQVFELLDEIYQQMTEYIDRTGHPPRRLALSPRSYRRLLELMLNEPALVGPLCDIRLIIDELMPDTEVHIEE